MPDPDVTRADPSPVRRPEPPANLLSYAGHQPTGKKLWWGKPMPASRVALIFTAVCVAIALVNPFPLHLSHGTYPGAIGSLTMLGAAFGTGVYLWVRIVKEPNVHAAWRALLFGAALACGPMTIWLYAELNPLRDGRRLARLWPDVRWPLAGLAGCVALFAAGRVGVWWFRRTSSDRKPPALPPPP